MNLSPLQARGADAIRAWLADPTAPQVFYLAGYAGCIDGAARMRFQTRTRDGKISDSKGGTLEQLYRRFNRLPNTRNKWVDPRSEGNHFYAASMAPGGKIFMNQILGVIDSGIRACLRITSDTNQKLTCTDNHPLFNGTDYVPAGALRIGDIVFVHNNQGPRGYRKPRVHRPEILVKHHPVGPLKIIGGRYAYRRIKHYKAVYEAEMNGLTLGAYIERLNAGKLEGLQFLPPGIDIHHEDDDPTNNALGNLHPITHSEHARQHALEHPERTGWHACATKITAIEFVGDRHVFDLRMSGPHHNFIADGFVVHNSGKSTLIKHLVSDVRGRICYAAFTGKAALVMRSKGCPTAQTIHSLIYRHAGERPSREQLLARLEEARAALAANTSGGSWRDMIATNIKRLEAELAEASDPKRGRGPKFRLNPASDAAFAALIVIDECSQVDSFLGKDLESFGTKILAIGDPAQLPPIYGAGYFTSREPDFLLDEVHRQAEDSPVLWAATKIRRGEDVPYGIHGGDLVVARRGDVENEARALAADQIIVGRNRTRRMTNRKVRDLRGFGAQSPWPVERDRLVCLRNDREAGLLNGSLWDVKSCKPEEETMEMQIEIIDPDQPGNEIDCRAWMYHVAGRDQELQGNFARRDLEEFDWGYALTTHKAQGSAWNSVYVLDESAAFGKDARSWLYTAATRAARSLVLVR